MTSIALRSVTNVAKLTLAISSVRAYSTEGHLGGGGQTAFEQREKAGEDYYIRQHEKEKLKALKAEIAETEKDLEKLKEYADALESKQDSI
jgi:hypothetical protein